jgi:cytochrome P450
MLGAAGRDETVFTDASRFLPGRAGPRSLGFGGGYHACIAGAFARMEVVEILNQVLAEVPNVEPLYDVNAPRWTNNPTFHGILVMPVAV